MRGISAGLDQWRRSALEYEGDSRILLTLGKANYEDRDQHDHLSGQRSRPGVAAKRPCALRRITVQGRDTRGREGRETRRQIDFDADYDQM